MIITLKGDNFSANNIGTLSTWTVLRVLGDGAIYNGVSYVDKNATLNATVTITDGYELGSAGISVTMGGNPVTSGVTSNGNTITINIASVTGNVVIKVPTVNMSTGEESSGKPIEVSTHEEMDALLVEENLDKIYKYVGESDDTYVNGMIYMVVESDTVIPSGVGATLNIEGGYEPVPIGVVIESATFNTSLGVTQVREILSNVTFEYGEDEDALGLYYAFSNSSVNSTVYIVDYKSFTGVENSLVIVGNMGGAGDTPIWVDPNVQSMFNLDFSGWNMAVFEQLGGNILPVGVSSDTTITQSDKTLIVGTQNDVISQIFNIGEKASIEKELKGDYDGVSVKATSNGNLDLLPYIDNKQIPTQVKVNVPQPTPNLQTKNATPSTSNQTITFDDGYDGLKQVTISGVTSSIDSDIVASNIKSGVNILGVTGTYVGKVIIENKMATEISDYAYYQMDALYSVEFDNVSVIGEYAFGWCENLIGAYTNTASIPLEIKTGAFNQCTSFTLFSFYPSIIRTQAFYNCSSLTTAYLSMLNTIEDGAFMRCSNLVDVQFKDSSGREATITKIPAACFSSCTKLTNINLPASVDTLSAVCFGNTNLTTLIINNTTKVLELIFEDTSGHIGSPFASTPLINGTGYVYVPDELVESYKADTSWQSALPNYSTQIKPLSEYVE